MKINSKLKRKQLVSVTEIAKFINSSDGIARVDLVRAMGSMMVKPLKQLEDNKIFKVKKMSGLTDKPVKVYYSNRTNYPIVKSNHYRALSIFCLRELGCLISEPEVNENGEWQVNLVLSEEDSLRLETQVVALKNISNISTDKFVTPLLIFDGNATFEISRQREAIPIQSICVVVEDRNIVAYIMENKKKFIPLVSLSDLTNFEKINHDSKLINEQIIKSYDLSKYMKKGGNQNDYR